MLNSECCFVEVNDSGLCSRCFEHAEGMPYRCTKCDMEFSEEEITNNTCPECKTKTLEDV